MASFSFREITHESVTIRFTGLTVGETVRVFIRLADASVTTVDETFAVTSSSKTVTYDGLEPGSDYLFNYKYVGADNLELEEAEPFTTEPPPDPRPEDWEWWRTIRAGRDILIEADEWNEFCDRINQFRAYTGVYAVEFTTARSGRTLISADICNEAWEAIGDISPVSMPARARAGRPITADFFNDLMDALNSIE